MGSHNNVNWIEYDRFGHRYGLELLEGPIIQINTYGVQSITFKVQNMYAEDLTPESQGAGPTWEGKDITCTFYLYTDEGDDKNTVLDSQIVDLKANAIYTISFYSANLYERQSYVNWKYWFKFRFQHQQFPDSSYTVPYELPLEKYSFPEKLDSLPASDNLILYNSLNNQEKILMISYNPAITNYAQVKNESLIQTLGSQYPFYRCNGLANYKQFSVGGLLSYHGEEEIRSTNFPLISSAELNSLSLTDNDYYTQELKREKTFRDRTLNLLYSNNPFVFISPTEGQLIIQLTKVSLTPNQQLGRTIWSFTAQATEIDSFNACIPLLHKLNILKVGEVT